MSGYFIEAGEELLFLSPLLILLGAGMFFLHKKKGYTTPLLHVALWVLFLACVQGMIYITGSASVGDLTNWREGILKAGQINLIPFRWGIGNWFGVIMNIFLFVPFGFLLPLLWKRLGRIQNTVLAGFLLSLTIEIGQLFNYRATDVDDLVANTLGTALGYLCYRLIGKRMADRLPLRVFGGRYSRVIHMEGAIWVGIMFLCNFFIMPFIRLVRWGIFF